MRELMVTVPGYHGNQSINVQDICLIQNRQSHLTTSSYKCDILPLGYDILPLGYNYYDPVAIYHGGGRILYDSLTTRHLVQV